MATESPVVANGSAHQHGYHQLCGMDPKSPIAIVGMACRLPGGVQSLKSFWDFCLAARNSWSEIPKHRLSTAAFYHPDAERSGSVSLSDRNWPLAR